LKFSAKRIIALLLVFGIVLGFKKISKQFRNSDTILGRISLLINRDNHLKVKSNTIDLNEIEIIWSPEFDKQITVYKNGKTKGKIGHRYGPNTFIIKHAQNEIAQIGHFKTNNWHSHDYDLRIELTQNSYILDFEADGPDQAKKSDTIPLIR